MIICTHTWLYLSKLKDAIVIFFSKTDEINKEESLGFILPQHEYFHQSMVLADCESELFRDCSRGLEGGSYFVATILNRREAKTQKGKDAIDPIKDYILLKADARFCHFFINKFKLDPNFDNTPDGFKSASPGEKELFLNKMVVDALKDLMPYFKESNFEDPQLQDHPLQEGRRSCRQKETFVPKQRTSMQGPMLIDQKLLDSTVEQIMLPDSIEDVVEKNVEKLSIAVSGTRSMVVFSCKICSFHSKYRTICTTHVETCLENQNKPDDIGPVLSDSNLEPLNHAMEEDEPEKTVTEDEDDKFWNYKNGEFFIDSLFGVSTMFERFGDGLGCYIMNKVLLPIFHGLKHSNYSTSIHRFITRVLCEATPKEGLKLIHERFSNRTGRPGENVPRDRRMEYRIGITKKLIGNLGPNFSQESVQHVNNSVDIKEELFYETRKSHGVNIREFLLLTFPRSLWQQLGRASLCRRR